VPIYDGGYNLVQSHYASMLQTIGYVMGDQCDHNNLLLVPYWFWGVDSAIIEEDDMPSIEELRAEFTGQTAEASHRVLSGWQQDTRRYHVFIVNDVRNAQWWAVFGIFKLKIVDGYAGWFEARPDVINLGDRSEGWGIAMVDTTLEVSVDQAGAIVGSFMSGDVIEPTADPPDEDPTS
jgi:hypothetical protein